MSRALHAATLVMLGACTQLTPPLKGGPAGFEVKVTQFFRGTGGARAPLDVVGACARRYGSQAQVPVEARGTQACPYVVLPGDLELQLEARALTKAGALAADFNNAVSVRVVPGDVQGGYENRTALAQGGLIATTVRARHLYGQVRVWVQDGPPALIFSDGGAVTAGLPDASFGSSYATGLSDIVWFDEPTLAKLQQPDGFDNRSSPFVGEFVTIGRRPEAGPPLLQSCSADPARDGQPLLMVVTGTDPSGFFVTDLSACRQVELTRDEAGATQVRQAEPPEACLKADGTPANGAPGTCAISKAACTTSAGCSAYLPGTFGSIFVFNFSFPDGLDTGDLLFTLGGSVQEFTSTSQLTFPSWTIAERVKQLPQSEWNKWLQFAVPQPINNRLCGMDNNPFVTDSLCGQNRRNLKLESLESSLVKLPNVKFPELFTDCDRNGDFSVPFFCEQVIDTVWQWGFCGGFDGTVEDPVSAQERSCNQDCVVGANAYAGKVCAERTTFVGFGQFPVELNRTGPARYGLDESIPGRVTSVSLERKSGADGGIAPLRLPGFGEGTAATLVCDADTRVAFGDGTVLATSSDRLLRAGEVLPWTFTAAGPVVGLLPEGATTADQKCFLAVHARARVNVVVKDAVPELRPDCSEADPDGPKAEQCKALRGATFDIVGHLKQVQPGRPRWLVVPRDADDVCCRPGPGLACPRPIKRCP